MHPKKATHIIYYIICLCVFIICFALQTLICVCPSFYGVRGENPESPIIIVRLIYL